MTEHLILFDALLLVTLVGTALVSLTSSDPQRAVILFVVFGLLLALVWARLGAVDVALAEAAIGAGLSGALLLRTAIRQTRGVRGPDTAKQEGGRE
ncbi:MAG: DUF4040 domain-containing protein [Chromatiaceae bacterium]|jgi:energy-converting hydrogenase B subunit D